MTDEPRAGLGGVAKLAIGCSIGCGVLAFGAVVFGLFWIFSLGDEVASEGVVGAESMGMVHVARSSGDDADLHTLFGSMMGEIQRQANRRQIQELPEPVRWLQDLSAAQGAGGVGLLFPRDLTVSIEPGEGGEPEAVLAANLKGFSRLIPNLMVLAAESAGENRSRTYRGYRINLLSDDSHFAFHGGMMLFATNAAVLDRAIDRIEDGAAEGPLSASLPSERVAGWDLYGSFLDHDDTLGPGFAALLESLGRGDGEAPAAAPEATAEPTSDPPADPAASVLFGLDVLTSDRLFVEVEVDAPSRAAAERWLERLRRSADGLERGAGRELLSTTFSGRVEGSRALAEVEVVGLEGLLSQLARDLFEEAEDGAQPQAR